MSANDTWPEVDEQVRFFLMRQEQILVWADLGRLAYAAAREMLASIDLDPGELGSDWIVGRKLAGRDHRGLFLYKAQWCVMSADEPDVALDLTCDSRDAVDPAGLSTTVKPYVGLIWGKSAVGRRIAAGLKVALKSARPKYPGAGWRKGDPHLAYRFMTDRDWFRHRDLWRRDLVSGLLEAAHHYETAVDEAVAASRR